MVMLLAARGDDVHGCMRAQSPYLADTGELTTSLLKVLLLGATCCRVFDFLLLTMQKPSASITQGTTDEHLLLFCINAQTLRDEEQ